MLGFLARLGSSQHAVDCTKLSVGVPHITLKSIANNAEIDVIWERYQETLEPLRAELNGALGQSWEEWRARGNDKHSLYADPQFVDVEARDFRLKDTSPVHDLGFEPIDTSSIGPRSKPGVNTP